MVNISLGVLAGRANWFSVFPVHSISATRFWMLGLWLGFDFRCSVEGLFRVIYPMLRAWYGREYYYKELYYIAQGNKNRMGVTLVFVVHWPRSAFKHLRQAWGWSWNGGGKESAGPGEVWELHTGFQTVWSAVVGIQEVVGFWRENTTVVRRVMAFIPSCFPGCERTDGISEAPGRQYLAALCTSNVIQIMHQQVQATRYTPIIWL